METPIFNLEMKSWNREEQEEYDQLLHGFDGVDEECCKDQETNFSYTAYWDDIERLLCSDFSFSTQFHADYVNPSSADFTHEPIVYNQDDHVFEEINMDDPVQLGNGQEYMKPLAALEILANYRKGGQLKRLRGTSLQHVDGASFTPALPQPAPTMNYGGLPRRVLSTEEVMRVAGARFIELADHRDIVVGEDHEHLSALEFTSSSLSDEETKDVELAHLLFAATEKVANQQYDRASRLLAHCQLFASPIGNPVERVVFYFAEALRERIDKATTSTGWNKKSDPAGVVPLMLVGEDTEEKLNGARPSLLAFHQLLPFSEVVQFTSVQAILNAVTTGRVIHIIDLSIRLGLQWTVLLQALSESRLRASSPSLELVKITAVATPENAGTADTGTRLTNFAAGLGIRLVFKVVVVADMKELREDMFKTAADEDEDEDEDETLVVYAPLKLRTMLVGPASLENLMRVTRRLRPALMAVVEVEADHNSVSFNQRFIEALFFYSAWFDCCDAAMASDDPNRIDTEAEFFAGGIRSMVAGEGPERVVRHVRLEVWRSFMARFGFEEVELGQMIFYQAGLILNRFGFGSSCTVDMDGKGMTTGWKGTPFMSVSAWKVK